ncbi:MAG: mce related protein [Candidatus Cloacimonetes bacterium ADurb.Bin088]|jgi:phospholipid/cholesterol/gamma-HCH transport system substrate-binding protein|nr:MAG: mce related protein [Candidatus Cloacimonetes bacterium ADurb.Bin088]
MAKFYPKLYQTQLKVGLFTVIMLLIAVFGYLWLSKRISIRSQQDLQVGFTDVMGLEVGDKAMFRGMEVGRIKSIAARGDDILVTARVNRGLGLKEGAVFYISDSSLMGGTVLNIAQGEGPGLLDLGKTQRGEDPTGVMALLGKANATLGEFNAVLSELRRENGLIAKSSSLLDDAGSAARSVEELSQDAKARLAATLQKIDSLSEQITRVAKANEEQINTVLQRSPQALENVSGTLDSLKALSANLSQTVKALNSGQGSAGLLLNDEALYHKLLRSVANLDSLVLDIRAHPKKYVKFSLF